MAYGVFCVVLALHLWFLGLWRRRGCADGLGTHWHGIDVVTNAWASTGKCVREQRWPRERAGSRGDRWDISLARPWKLGLPPSCCSQLGFPPEKRRMEGAAAGSGSCHRCVGHADDLEVSWKGVGGRNR
jgi:hypothetical protein